MQFIPEIAKDESVQVVNFCRTASWLVPHVSLHNLLPPTTCSHYIIVSNHSSLQLNYTFPTYLKWAFANVPFLLRSYRAFVAARVRFVSRSVKDLVRLTDSNLYVNQYEIRYIAFQKAYRGAMAAARTVRLFRSFFAH